MLKILGKIVFSSEILHILCTAEGNTLCFPPRQWMNVFFLFVFFMFRHAWSTHACCNCNLSCRLGRRKLLFAMGFHSVISLCSFVTTIPISLHMYKYTPLSLSHTQTHTHSIWDDYIYIYTYIHMYVCMCVCVCVRIRLWSTYSLSQINLTLEQAKMTGGRG